MEASEVEDWFAQYLSAFAALGRGETLPADVVPYYGVPFLLTTDDVIVSLGTVDEVAAWLQSQADATSAMGYNHTETLASDVAIYEPQHSSASRQVLAPARGRHRDQPDVGHLRHHSRVRGLPDLLAVVALTLMHGG